MLSLPGAEKVEIERCFSSDLRELLSSTQLAVSDSFVQHGDTSVLLHSAAVAFYGYKLANRLGLKNLSRRELVRGALLHDYFLYDWHIDSIGIHGFTHPRTALENARRDTDITPAEAEIIKKHMFPLTVTPPTTGAAWIVCLVDKVCSLYETFNRGVYAGLRLYIDRCLAETFAGKEAA